MGTLLSEPWIKYKDTYGWHWCQPDTVLEARDRVLCVESKLSLRRREVAIAQLDKLYRPVLTRLYDKPVVMVVAFRHWLGEFSDDPRLTIDHPSELMGVPHSDLKQPFGWNYLGI